MTPVSELPAKLRRCIMPAVLIGLAPAFGNAQKSTGPPVGTLIVDGGAATNPVVTRFVELAGGVRSRIVAIPTGASSIRFGPENVILDLDWPRDRKEWRDYEAYLENWFGVEDIVILHTRDRSEADAVHFVEPLNAATGVFLAPGNSGRYAAAYLGTGTQKELLALLERGGVIFGSSAGRDYSRFFPRARPA